MRNFNGSLIVPKNLKKGPFGIFNIRSVAKYQKNERRTLWGHLNNIEKKSHKAEKSHSAEKSENLLLRNTCKK